MRQVLEHQGEYSSLTAAAAVVARREGLGKETVRRWVVQAQIDGGQRQGATSEELAEIKDLKAKVRRLLEGIRPSIESVGDAHDNALMECVIGLFKTECIRTTVFHDGPYRSVHDVEYATAGWVDWYNQRRLHSSLGYLTPTEYEQAHHAALNREPAPV